MNDATKGSLNQYLQPQGSPITDKVHPANAFYFNRVAGRNSVTATKIKNFTFDKATGGTLTLGGLNNQNGRLVMRDSNGNILLVLDSSGINGTQSGSVTTTGTNVFTGGISSRNQILLIAAGASGGAPTSFFTSSNSPQGLDSGRFQMNPDNFPANKFYLEAIYRAGTSGQEFRKLFMDVYDLTGGSAIANGTFTGTTQSGAGFGVYPRERSIIDFRPSMVSGNRDYMLRYWGTSVSGTVFVDLYEARLILDF